jgi:nitrate reductase NapE component
MELAKHLQFLFISIHFYPFLSVSAVFFWKQWCYHRGIFWPPGFLTGFPPSTLEACPDGPFDGMTGESRKNLAKQLYRRHWKARNGELGTGDVQNIQETGAAKWNPHQMILER